MRQQCGANASGPPSSCEPGSTRSEALVLELPRLARGQAQREKSLRSARVALAQLRLVATPPDAPRRVRAKMVNSMSWGLRRSPLRHRARGENARHSSEREPTLQACVTTAVVASPVTRLANGHKAPLF